MINASQEFRASLGSSSPSPVDQFRELGQRIHAQIAKAVIGQGPVIEQVMIALFAAGHVLIEGVPGLGKTLLVKALAKTFQGRFARIQFTPDLMPSDVSGHAIYDPKTERFAIRRGPVFTHLLLADEINRAPAKTQSALLEVMQEQQVTIEGKGIEVPRPFMTLATQNSLEHEGTYPLPEAQLDRFLLKIQIDYPEEEEEVTMVETITRETVGDGLDVSRVDTVADPQMILAIQQAGATVRVDPQVNRYAVSITRSTRQCQGISTGAGPRGAIAMIRAARAVALLEGRDYVIPDDVKRIALPALRHRIALTPERELDGQSTDDVLQTIIDRADAPRE
ncbi:MAG: MoxR family ATPase [Gammaproteobacteria bacterium]|nr:MoxR family ATPase [Gammaproteobacteria bacterium]